MLSCGVVKGETDGAVLLFTFPKYADLQKVWIDFTESPDPFEIKDARICSDHFLPDHDYRTVYGDLPRRFRMLKDARVEIML